MSDAVRHRRDALDEGVPVLDERLVEPGLADHVHVDEQGVLDVPADRQADQLRPVGFDAVPVEVLRLLLGEGGVVDAGREIFEPVLLLGAGHVAALAEVVDVVRAVGQRGIDLRVPPFPS